MTRSCWEFRISTYRKYYFLQSFVCNFYFNLITTVNQSKIFATIDIRIWIVQICSLFRSKYWYVCCLSFTDHAVSQPISMGTGRRVGVGTGYHHQASEVGTVLSPRSRLVCLYVLFCIHKFANIMHFYLSTLNSKIRQAAFIPMAKHW